MAENFRIRFNVPRDFAYEPGFVRATFCKDFRPDKDSYDKTYRDPATGLLMLQPDFFKETYGQGFKSLSAWDYVAGDWEEFTRAAEVLASGSGGDPKPRMYTPLFPPTTGSVLSVLSSITLATAIRGSQLLDDRLLWAMESTFELGDDEGFALHVRGATDEMRRQKNFFLIQWGHVNLHMGYDGVLSCYLWEDRDDLTGDPTLFWQESFVDPGNIGNRDLWIMVVPIPGFGLSVSHSLTGPQNWRSAVSTGWQNATKAVLIPVESEVVDGVTRVVRQDVVRLAVNPSLNASPRLGFYVLSYPSSGTFTDAAFDFGYKPSGAPEEVAGRYIGNAATSATSALKKIDGTTAWATGERQGKVKVTLSTSDPRYTPFVYSTYVRKDGVRATYDAEALEPDYYNLSWSEDEYGRREGVCVATFSSAEARLMCERGDTTFQLDYRPSPEDEWTPVFQGLAALKEPLAEIFSSGGASVYQAIWQLSDDTELLDEVSLTLQTAFDGLSIGEAINVILTAAGEERIDTLDIPATLLAVTVPALSPNQGNFRHGVKRGEHGYKMARTLLNLARRENTEWQLVKRNVTGSDDPAWFLRQKPRDTALDALWYATPFEDEIGTAIEVGVTPEQVLRWVSADGVQRYGISPPEANYVQAVGYTGTDPNTAERVLSVPVINADSLNNSTSGDYLGRFKKAYPEFQNLAEQGDLNVAAIRVYTASAHRKISAAIPIVGYLPSLHPNQRWKVRGYDSAGGREDKFDGADLWGKRVIWSILGCDGDDYEIVTGTVEVNSNWYGGME
jgi:hypothetical protein